MIYPKTDVNSFNLNLHKPYMKTAHDLVTAAKSHIQEIPLDLAQSDILRADILIDVREKDEFLNGHIAGAVHIPRGLLEFKLSATPEFGTRDLNIVLYCKSGGRAALCALALQEMGYLKVSSIAGGIDAWIESGRAVVKPEIIAFE